MWKNKKLARKTVRLGCFTWWIQRNVKELWHGIFICKSLLGTMKKWQPSADLHTLFMVPILCLFCFAYLHCFSLVVVHSEAEFAHPIFCCCAKQFANLGIALDLCMMFKEKWPKAHWCSKKRKITFCLTPLLFSAFSFTQQSCCKAKIKFFFAHVHSDDPSAKDMTVTQCWPLAVHPSWLHWCRLGVRQTTGCNWCGLVPTFLRTVSLSPFHVRALSLCHVSTVSLSPFIQINAVPRAPPLMWHPYTHT